MLDAVRISNHLDEWSPARILVHTDSLSQVHSNGHRQEERSVAAGSIVSRASLQQRIQGRETPEDVVTTQMASRATGVVYLGTAEKMQRLARCEIFHRRDRGDSHQTHLSPEHKVGRSTPFTFPQKLRNEIYSKSVCGDKIISARKRTPAVNALITPGVTGRSEDGHVFLRSTRKRMGVDGKSDDVFNPTVRMIPDTVSCRNVRSKEYTFSFPRLLEILLLEIT